VLQEATNKRNELNWLLKNSFPAVCEELWQNFDDCMRFIKKSAHNDTETEHIDENDPVMHLGDSRIVRFPSPTKAVRGFVVLEGWNIKDAEITVSFSRWRKGVPFKTMISSTNPWRLKQIQSVYNICKSMKQILSQATSRLDLYLINEKKKDEEEKKSY